MDGFNFKIEGWEEVIMAIKQMPDKVKANEIKKILRRQAKPALRALDSKTPFRESGRDIKRGNNVYKPGNLKRSNRIKTRGKDYPTAFVGAHVPSARAKKTEGSGYYGYFLQYGLGRHKEPNDYVQEARDEVATTLGKSASEELKRYIAKKAIKMGFEVK